MEWGAEVSRDYYGWLTLADGSGGDSSEVTVHFNFGSRTVEDEIQEESSEGKGRGYDTGVHKTPDEEGSGKVAPSSPEE